MMQLLVLVDYPGLLSLVSPVRPTMQVAAGVGPVAGVAGLAGLAGMTPMRTVAPTVGPVARVLPTAPVAPVAPPAEPFPQSERSARFYGEKLLPPTFRPTPNSVICGRGKHCYASVGNLRLREIVLRCLPQYSAANGKKEKSEIVTLVMETVCNLCPGRRGAFIKMDNLGRWYEVGEQVARERISSIFRDFLHTSYRSSSKSRVSRRQRNRDIRRLASPDKGGTKSQRGLSS